MLVNSTTGNSTFLFGFGFCLLVGNTLFSILSLFRARDVGRRLERKRSGRRWEKEKERRGVGGVGGGSGVQQCRLHEDARQCESKSAVFMRHNQMGCFHSRNMQDVFSSAVAIFLP